MVDENDLFGDEEEDDVDLASLLENLFTESRKNRNIVEVLLEIKRSIDMNTQVLKNVLTSSLQLHQTSLKVRN